MQGEGSLQLFHQLEKERQLKGNPWTAEAKQLQKFDLIFVEINSGLTQLHNKQHSLEQALLRQTVCKHPALSLALSSSASSGSSLWSPQNHTPVPQA